MAEHTKSITDARQGLPGLSHNAAERMERYIITQQGQPQSVLLGFKDYQGLVATVDLLQQPAALANLHRGLKQIREGQGMTFEEMEARLERAEAGEEGVAFEPVTAFDPIVRTIEVPEVGNIEVTFTRMDAPRVRDDTPEPAIETKAASKPALAAEAEQKARG